MGGIAVCERLRASSAGVADVDADAVGVFAPLELPCRDSSGRGLLLPPLGVRSPSPMMAVVLAGGAGRSISEVLDEAGAPAQLAVAASTCTSQYRESAAVRSQL